MIHADGEWVGEWTTQQPHGSTASVWEGLHHKLGFNIQHYQLRLWIRQTCVIINNQERKKEAVQMCV